MGAMFNHQRSVKTISENDQRMGHDSATNFLKTMGTSCITSLDDLIV